MIMAMTRESVKDFYGRIIGAIETYDNGDKKAKDQYGKILGFYDKRQNVTKDAYGKIVARGDTTSSLIWQAYNEWKLKNNIR